MRHPIISFLLLSLWSSLVTAQFGFFDHIFGNQQQQWQQRPSPGQSQYNVPADSGGFYQSLCNTSKLTPGLLQFPVRLTCVLTV